MAEAIMRERDQEAWNAAWLDYREVNRKRMRRRFRIFGFDALPRDTSILDIGAGCGDFLALLQGAGFTRLRGIEPEAELVAQAPPGLIERGSIGDLSRISGTFDIVTVFGVLHHLRDLDEMKEAVANIRRVLGEGGRFYSAEPWKHLLRTLVTRVFLETPLGQVHPYFRLESRIWRVEKPRFERWLHLERAVVRHVTGPGGFRIVFGRRDLRARYSIYERT